MKCRTSFNAIAGCFFLLSQTWGFTDARLVNVTVDDFNPDPVTGNTFLYFPEGYWNIGNNCSVCEAKPDTSRIYQSTWHDVTYIEKGPRVEERVVQTALFQFDGESFARAMPLVLTFPLSLTRVRHICVRDFVRVPAGSRKQCRHVLSHRWTSCR